MNEVTKFMQGKVSDGHVTVELQWRENDPLAVTATVYHADDVNHWSFALDLLEKGGGKGDVNVYSLHGRTNLILYPFESNSYQITFPDAYIDGFIREIPRSVPTQRIIDESLDNFLDSLLAG